MDGLKFYLVPDMRRMRDAGILETVVAAMNQAFFTLSLGIGSMAIFGSYIDKKHTLLGADHRLNPSTQGMDSRMINARLIRQDFFLSQ